MQGVLTPTIEFWSFGSPERLPSPHLKSVSFILTLSQSRVATHLTYFGNHWSTLKTCQQFMEKILIPYHKNEGEELNLLQNQKDGMANRLLISS